MVSTIKLGKIIDELISRKLEDANQLQVFRVTNVREETYSCDIKMLAFKTQYNNVPVMGFGLGNAKGLLCLPKVNDFVLVAFIFNKPFVIGSFFDIFTTIKDNVPEIKEGEVLIIAKENGSSVYINSDDEIIIKKKGDNKPKIKINSSDDIQVWNKDVDATAKIEVKSDGTILVSGSTIQVTSGTKKFLREGDNITVGTETGAVVLNSAGGKMVGGD
jgi:hypothetical protein